ncbi:hypothetical protein ACH0B5_15530 [Ureibacillus sp. 179-F W5.1 NHS]|uniref:hypothetical protein n=1 Tax=Ureibacillus sp. 179-F W5.1 NHS TaxID=3374297 RepID=UPI00387A4675
MLKKNILAILFFAFIFNFLHIDTASAAPKLDVKAEAGISNKVKYYTPVPLKLTITNNGTAFSGDLVIDAAESYSMGSGLVYPLDIAEGETKEIQIYLNGLAEDYMYSSPQKTLFYFYEGGIEDGEMVKYTGSKTVKPQFHEQEATFIYTLTENSDRLSSLLRLRQYSTFNVEVFNLNQLKNYEFPTDEKGLAMANVLAVDEISLTDFSEEQQNAIYSWVEKGGVLLIGASDQVEASVGIFKDYLPLSLSNEKVTVSQERLKTLSQNGVFTQDIDVYKATEKEGSHRLLADGNTILASKKTLGSGQIIQTTFSLGDQPLASMDGYSKLLSEILKLQTTVQNNSFAMNFGNFNDYLPHEVGSVNELFPSFEISTTMLVIVIIIYILFIGPMLYFILKRMDKREHAWWLIPLLSIGLSLCLFIFGAKDRLMQSQIQQAAFYKVEGDSLTGKYMETILTNRSGDFTFNLDENTTATASQGMDYYYSSPADNVLHEKSYVKERANGSIIQLRNLNYWSVQSIVGETTIHNAGNMDIQLTVKDGLIEGTVTNHFPFKLNDVTIWSGTKEIELGDIESEGTLKVLEQVKNSVLLSPAITNYGYNAPQSKDDLLPMRLEKVKYGAGGLIQDDHAPTIIAWTDESLVGIELDGNAEVSPVAYIAQTFEPKMELSGGFTLNKDTLEEYVEPTNAASYMELTSESSNEWYLDKGDYNYTVQIPSELIENSSWTELSVSNKASNRLEIAIWNIKTSQFEDIQEASITFKDNLDQYVSTDGQIKMLVRLNDYLGTPVRMPDVEIKGVAQ